MNNLSYSRKFSDFYIETSDLVDQYFLNNQISKTGDLKLLSDKYQKQDDKNWYKTDDKGE